MRVLVVGDIMLDRYIYGSVKRISPEAPVPVFNRESEKETLGGCGNVCVNLAKLGVDVECVAWIGDDADGCEIISLILKNGIGNRLSIYGGTKTTVKNRIVDKVSGQQLLRIDDEAVFCVGVNPNELFGSYDAIIVSDYGKGAIDAAVMNTVKNLGAPVIVDPYPEHGWWYDNVFMITPNEKEYNELRHKPDCSYVLKTLGANGMVVSTGFGDVQIPAQQVKIYDVQGAGDTVVAVMAYCIGSGMDVVESAKIANQCAGYVVTQPGTAYVPKEILVKAIANV